MELKIVQEGEKNITVEIKEESITFANLIKETLWQDSSVTEAACIKEHPYLAEPKVFVKVSKGDPLTALQKAAERIATQIDEFGQQFKKAIK